MNFRRPYEIAAIIFLFSVSTENLIAQQSSQTASAKSYALPNACGITVNAGPDITICAGIGKNLTGNVTNSTDYHWEPPDGLNNDKVIRPIATPMVTTTYTLIAKAMSGNLIMNGNFETGSLAPSTSQYTPYTDLNLWAASTGGYMVMSVPQIAAQFGCNPNVGAFALAITPTGSSQDIWCQTRSVNPNTDYKIEYKLIGIPYIFGSPPDIGLKVNGVLVGSAEPASGFCTETTASFVWNSGASVSANFCLANYGGTGTFAICAIDDITVKECCEERDDVVVTVYDLIAEIAPPIEINCFNKPITLDASASSQGAGITYDWMTTNGHIVSGDKTLMPIVDAPGTYTLKLIGLYGCEKETTVVVSGSVTPPDVKIKSVDIDCQNATGSIEASSKSTSPQFEWNGPNGFYSTRPNNYNLTEAGEYIVKVTDSYGCESTAKVEIKDNRTLIEAEIAGDTITCSKDSAILKASSIARKPIYKWSGTFNYKNDSSDFAVVKDTGWYYLSTTDSLGCKELDSFYVRNLQSNIPLIITTDTITCATQQVQLKLQTDTSTTIQWKGPNGFTSDSIQPHVTDPGWYYVEVKSKNGCVRIDSVFVEKSFDLPDVFITGNDTITCDKPTVTIFGGGSTGIHSIEWKTPTGIIKFVNTIQAVDSGIYTLFVTGINGCLVTKSITIFKDVDLPIIISKDDTLTCDKDTVNLNVSVNNVRNFSWSGPNNFTSNSLAPFVSEKGNYILTVTANNGCQSTATLTIEEDKSIPGFSILTDTINCIRTSFIPIVLTDSTAISFNWTGPNGFSSILKSPVLSNGGSYALTVKGKNGCDSTQTITVIEDTQKPVASLEADTIQCKTTANIRALNVTPGATIQWRGPNGFTSNLPNATITQSGFYIITMTGTNGCVFEDSIFVFQKDQLPDIFAFNDTLDCNRPKLFLNGGSITPGVLFEWTGPNGFTSNVARPEILDSGIYTLKVTDPNGCEATRQIHIIKNAESPVLNIIKSNANITCKDSLVSIQLNANQTAKNILWLGPNGFQSNLDQFSITQPGLYLVIFTNEFGCIARDSFIIQDLRSLPDFSVADDSISCKRTSATLQLTSNDPNLSFQWSGPNNFSSTSKNPVIQFGGMYTVTASDTGGCQHTKTVFVKSDTAKPDLSISADTITCIRPSAPVKASSSLQGFTMRWTGPNNFTYTLPQFATTVPGRYFCTITNPRSGCSTTTFVDVLEDTSRIRGATVQVQNVTCDQNGKIFITSITGGKAPYRFSIDSAASFHPDLSALDLGPGTYNIIVEDDNGCRYPLTVTIDQDKSVDIDLPDLIQLKEGQQGQIHLDILADTAFVAKIIWDPSDQLSCNDCPNPVITAKKDQRIYVTVIDENGCSDTASILIQILIEAKIYFPNTFSPNGDNINDYFFPIGVSETAEVSYMRIYDRWGNQVFERNQFKINDERAGWNGLSGDNQKANPGVFIYVVEVIDQGKTYKFFGDITLVQ